MNSQEKLITIKGIFLNIGKQMLETSYTLNLGQLLKVALELKRYLWQKLKLEKIQNVSRATTYKQVGSLVLELGITIVAIDNHMVVIQVHIGKNTIEDVLLDGGFGINIITKQLKLRLGLLKPKPTPYNLRIIEIALEDKVYSKMYYSHQPWNVIMDETPTKIKAQEF